MLPVSFTAEITEATETNEKIRNEDDGFRTTLWGNTGLAVEAIVENGKSTKSCLKMNVEGLDLIAIGPIGHRPIGHHAIQTGVCASGFWHCSSKAPAPRRSP